MNNEHRLRLCGGGCNEQDAQRVLHTDSRLFDRPLDGLFDLGESMNRNDITRIAQEAGLHIATDVNWMPIIGLEYAERFAKLVAEHEREACANVCDEQMRGKSIWIKGAEASALAIRARGQA